MVKIFRLFLAEGSSHKAFVKPNYSSVSTEELPTFLYDFDNIGELWKD